MKPDFDMGKLKDVSLEISQIQFTCKIWGNKRIHRRGGLISFSGYYAPGAKGARDATFIKWKIDELCSLGHPLDLDGLVVDFTDLDYVWGDNIVDTPAGHLPESDHEPESFPVLTVVKESRFEAFAGMIDKRRLRTDLRTALAEMNQRFQNTSPR